MSQDPHSPGNEEKKRRFSLFGGRSREEKEAEKEAKRQAELDRKAEKEARRLAEKQAKEDEKRRRLEEKARRKGKLPPPSAEPLSFEPVVPESPKAPEAPVTPPPVAEPPKAPQPVAPSAPPPVAEPPKAPPPPVPPAPPVASPPPAAKPEPQPAPEAPKPPPPAPPKVEFAKPEPAKPEVAPPPPVADWAPPPVMPRPEAPAPEVAPAPPAQAGDKAPLEPPVQTPVQEPVQEKTVPAPAAPLPPSDAPPPAEAAQEGPKDGETPKEGEAAKEGEESEEEEQKSWLRRLFDALARSSGRLAQGIVDLFAKRKLDDDTLQELEDLLITADMGVETSARLCTALAKERFGKHVPPEEVKAVLAEEIADILEPVAKPLEIDRKAKPHVVLVVGVNGAGKTTTIGKLARYFKRQGRTVSMAAGDTFRAAAVEQLKVWGGRTACHVFARETGADAASLAFDAYTEAQNYGDDVLLIDTAGRLQNKVGLMEELKKIVRVLRKVDESAPHTCLLVLDATVGQNAHSQVETFRDMIEVNGLVMTKLDGTARGGVIVALADRFGLPIHALGVGEKIDDLRPFKARDFANSLMGLDEKSAGLLGGGKE